MPNSCNVFKCTPPILSKNKRNRNHEIGNILALRQQNYFEGFEGRRLWPVSERCYSFCVERSRLALKRQSLPRNTIEIRIKFVNTMLLLFGGTL
jgi:hypothetical protein